MKQLTAAGKCTNARKDRRVIVSTNVLDVVRAIEKMDDDGVKTVYTWLTSNFHDIIQQVNWKDIEEEEPDTFDLEMIEEAANNPDCKEYVSSDDMFARLLADR